MEQHTCRRKRVTEVRIVRESDFDVTKCWEVSARELICYTIRLIRDIAVDCSRIRSLREACCLLIEIASSQEPVYFVGAGLSSCAVTWYRDRMVHFNGRVGVQHPIPVC